MNKKIAIIAIWVLMMCSIWGAAIHQADFLQPANELKKVLKTSIPTIVYSGKIFDNGIPGGPPGTPG